MEVPKITTPEGFIVSVLRLEFGDQIDVYKDYELTASVAIYGRVTSLFRSDETEGKVCAWCENGRMRWYLSFDADQREKQQPYIATCTGDKP